MSDNFQVTATPVEAVPDIISELKASFASGKTLSIEWRKQQLRQLWKLLDENEEAIRQALKKDLGKPIVQTHVLEIILVKNDAKDMIDNLDKWLGVESIMVPPPFENWSPVFHRRPKGVCLVIGAWNYPITLNLLPFLGVIACGNTGILKPSELSPHTSTLLADLFPKYLDSTCFKVLNGDKTIAQRLLQEPYGHILYTGGTAIGRIVMRAAADHLTPVTLELGGRNAALVTENADVELAATRVAWAKFAAAGQTCFAPNHAVVHESIYDAFVEALIKTYKSYYPQQATVEKVGKIVNNAHWKRLTSLLASTKGKVILGGKGDESSRFLEPTVITSVLEDDPIVQDELFGPFLPVLRYSTPADLSRLQQKLSPTPLAVYVFSSDLVQANEIASGSMAGTAAINDCMAQVAPTSLPFGGFGNSGIGGYRGKASIDTFSHKQSVVTVPTAPEFEALLGWRYPYAESMETVEFVKANLEARL
ncbi:Aldehyde dehydrogenase family 3 member A1 [Hyphodiscus hymeniophilus]|uniref:Aldehyde dehydrogenase n=1 Tax=Hyphodiscus hymeniophilus TaxID=353542 RepID=A0A9P7AX84_9HELO|nr:Aldehyde dehydrogenase family 3 member A1 [Hyphodiscus hymeniophilus]